MIRRLTAKKSIKEMIQNSTRGANYMSKSKSRERINANDFIQIVKNTKPRNMFEPRTVSEEAGKRNPKIKIFSSLNNSDAEIDQNQRGGKRLNVLQEMTSSAYLKDLYDNCPEFEELVPVYGTPKTNWQHMTTFILKNSSEDLKQRWSMASNYLKKKDGHDNIVRLMALSKVKKREISDREAQFPFHYQNIKESKLRKMELDHEMQKANIERMKVMQLKLKKWKTRQEKKLIKDLKGKNLADVQKMLKEAQLKQQKDRDKMHKCSNKGADHDMNTRMVEIVNQSAINLLQKIATSNLGESKRLDKHLIKFIINDQLLDNEPSNAPLNFPLRRTRTRMFKRNKRKQLQQALEDSECGGLQQSPEGQVQLTCENHTNQENAMANEENTNSILRTESSVNKQLKPITEVITPNQTNVNFSAMGIISSHQSIERGHFESPAKNCNLNKPQELNIQAAKISSFEKPSNLSNENMNQQMGTQNKNQLEKQSANSRHYPDDGLQQIQPNRKLMLEQDSKTENKLDGINKLQTQQSQNQQPKKKAQTSISPNLTNLKLNRLYTTANDNQEIFAMSLLKMQKQESLAKSRYKLSTRSKIIEQQVSSSLSQSSSSIQYSSSSGQIAKPDTGQGTENNSDDTSLNTNNLDENSQESNKSETFSISSILKNGNQMDGLKQIQEQSDSSRQDETTQEQMDASVTTYHKCMSFKKLSSRGQRVYKQKAAQKNDVNQQTQKNVMQKFEVLQKKIKQAQMKQNKLQENTKQFIQSQVNNSMHSMHESAHRFLRFKLKHKPISNIRSTSDFYKKISNPSATASKARAHAYGKQNKTQSSSIIAKNMSQVMRDSKSSASYAKYQTIQASLRLSDPKDAQSNILEIDQGNQIANRNSLISQEYMAAYDNKQYLNEIQNGNDSQQDGGIPFTNFFSKRNMNQQRKEHVKFVQSKVDCNECNIQRQDQIIQKQIDQNMKKSQKRLSISDYVENYQEMVRRQLPQSQSNSTTKRAVHQEKQSKDLQKVRLDARSLNVSLLENAQQYDTNITNILNGSKQSFSVNTSIQQEIKIEPTSKSKLQQINYRKLNLNSHQATINGANRCRNSALDEQQFKIQSNRISTQNQSKPLHGQTQPNQSKQTNRSMLFHTEISRENSPKSKFRPYVYKKKCQTYNKSFGAGMSSNLQRQIQQNNSKLQNNFLNSFVEQYDCSAKMPESELNTKRKSSIESTKFQDHSFANTHYTGPYSQAPNPRKRKGVKVQASKEDSSSQHFHQSRKSIDERMNLQQVNDLIRSQNTMVNPRNSIDSGSYNFTQFLQQPNRQEELAINWGNKATNKTMMQSNQEQSPKTVSTNVRGSMQSMVSSGHYGAPTDESQEAVAVAEAEALNNNQIVNEISRIAPPSINLANRCDTTLTDNIELALSNRGKKEIVKTLVNKNRRIQQFLNRQSQRVTAMNLQLEVGRSNIQPSMVASDTSLSNSYLINQTAASIPHHAKLSNPNRFRQAHGESSNLAGPFIMSQDYSGLNLFMNQNQSASDL